MKNLRKLFVFAPIMVLSLTACEGKLSEDKVKERMNKYNASEVAEQYKTFDAIYKVTVTKKTGVFGEGGMLESVGNSIETMYDSSAESFKDQPASNGVFTTSALSDSLLALDDLGLKFDLKFTYYHYQSTGLKINTDAKADLDMSGYTMKVTAKSTMYVLDDGRIEKDNSTMKMSVSGDVGGVKISGDLDADVDATYNWKK